jgi:hypothetical protein
MRTWYILPATWHRGDSPAPSGQHMMSRQLSKESSERRISALGRQAMSAKSATSALVKAFWTCQGGSSEGDVGLQSAYWGFEGTLREIWRSGDYYALKVVWGRRIVTLSAECERFSHLDSAKPGWIVRALEWRLQGLRNSPRALFTPTSELFLVSSASSTL